MNTKEIKAKTKVCCIFDCPSVDEAANKMLIDNQLKTVVDYDCFHIRADGSWNMLHDLDYGDRQLMKCKNCGALLLRQYSYCPCYFDGYPMKSIIYYSVDSSAEALEINEKYSGFDFEYKYLEKSENMWIDCTDGKWRWSKDEAKRKKMIEDVLEAARTLAKELHRGQTDKAGKDYFSEHLRHVAEHGVYWTVKVTGYLHDAAEDTPYSVEQVMQMLQEKCNNQLCSEDAKEIQEALNLMNCKMASSRKEYIARISKNNLAACVKMDDLKHNMDISRIENPTEKDFERVKRYKKEYDSIYKAYSKAIDERIDKYNE
jgi:hypothetical protein